MPILNNPRWERFAQELAKGKSAAEAYIEAGFKPSRQNAATLRHKQDISNRVDELLAERDRMAIAATEKATDALAIDRQWVMAELIEIAQAAKSGAEYGPANRALELLGKELGMFIERSENINTNYEIAADLPTEADWEAEHSTAH